jgi:hypothetical protein
VNQSSTPRTPATGAVGGQGAAAPPGPVVTGPPPAGIQPTHQANLHTALCSSWTGLAAGARREGTFLALDEVVALAQACRGSYAELVYVLAMQGLRWGELAGLQVGDRVKVPGPGLRLSRAVLASNGGGEL